MTKQWTLRELAEETGVSGRTIRFYISRELLHPPLKGGRGAAYGPAHKTLLETIKKLQASGMMLAEISHAFAREGSWQAERRGRGNWVASPQRILCPELEVNFKMNRVCSSSEMLAADPVPALPEPETWRSYSVANDVVVMLRAGTSPWRTKLLLSALCRFAAQVEDEGKKESKSE
jgi:DNA-binding transcriptional MerR regulator